MRRLLPKSREGRLVLGALAVVVAVNLVTVVVDAFLPSPEGPRSSSFATSPEGAAAWAELVRRSGGEVRRLRERPSDDTLPAEGTRGHARPGELHARAGAGAAPLRRARRAAWWRAGRGRGAGWPSCRRRSRVRAGTTAATRGPACSAPPRRPAERRVVRTAEVGHWESDGDAQPLVAGADGPMCSWTEPATGRSRYVADASPLQNRLLGEADNAALALGLAGPGLVVFVESVHGYGTATGLAALPDRFRWALVLLACSGLLLIVARWPRMGPPEPPEEPLFPPRRAYVDALAATLAKSHDRTRGDRSRTLGGARAARRRAALGARRGRRGMVRRGARRGTRSRGGARADRRRRRRHRRRTGAGPAERRKGANGCVTCTRPCRPRWPRWSWARSR